MTHYPTKTIINKYTAEHEAAMKCYRPVAKLSNATQFQVDNKKQYDQFINELHRLLTQRN